MGRVSLRPEANTLYFDFRFRGERCREYTMLEDSPTNRKKMEGVLKRIESEIALGTFEYALYFPNSPKAAKFSGSSGAAVRLSPASGEPLPTFKDFALTWKGEKAVEWRASYLASIESILAAHLIPAFGDKSVGAISREDLLGFRATLATKPIGQAGAGAKRNITPTTVNRVMGILRMILDEAVLRHGIQNPFIKIKRLKQRKTDIQPFSIEEVRKILETVRPDFRDYLTVRFFTGMRSGEVNGLKWKFVDFDRRQILVRETFSAGRTEYTKTDGSQREIDMSQVVFDALKRQYEVTGKASEYVFCNGEGNPLDNKNFDSRIWRPLLRLLGYADRRPYQMRHTCATLWLAAGENPQWIARQLGHTTTEMLFRVYARFVPNLTRKDGSAFDRLITAAVNGGVASNDAPAAGGKEVAHG
jgi:integrase